MTPGRTSAPQFGGCACGAVRYRIDEEPYDAGWCHCRICQQVSGSGGMVFATVRRACYHIERGADRIGRFASTPFGERSYCRDCAAPLTIHVRHQPGEIDIAVASLDDPDAISPGFHLYAAMARLGARY
ncbi:GFA family protein [Sphingopyxis sp. 113P3]|jgi:Uncharacterized conserved protein|uniref:GFA family protein n=1 Tax=Sphingopyxis sp. (strain 113P3) TaxID=292913 RepID=UPI0006AD2181|nr:GFA family protein [Sphingopyxis sp. 113P3]ALC11460.1 hypothetical protein LH20_05785 [Sphingopyxis sp. 113P3]